MLPGEDKMHFSVSEQDDCFRDYEMQTWATFGRQYHAVMDYNESYIVVSVDGVRVVDTARSGTAPEFLGKYIYVWMSSDEPGCCPAPTANVTLSNIIIVTYNAEDGFTLPPTLEPTSVPTLEPTLQLEPPSMEPTVVNLQ